MSSLPPHSASLRPFFTPNGVAVIGASRDPTKLSYAIMGNLTDPGHAYAGPIYPVNPKASEVCGLKCYADIADVPDPVELAVLVIPAALVPAAIGACGRRGIKAAIVISGGFREIGPEGAAREQQMVEIAQRYGVRIVGPNGIGVIDTHTPLDTTFVRGMPPKGHIAFLSQSGALCGGVIDWTIGRSIGFSRFLSVGNEADVNESDVLTFLAADETSRVITLYLEDVKGGPAFVDALRSAAARKPVLALKTGRTASGQAATASHTGALAGAHAAFRAACKQTGVIELETMQGLFNAALALAYQPLPAGNRIALVTNSGGPAALAADTLEAAGLRLAHTSPAVQDHLTGVLGADVQVMGPVDLLGGGGERHYRIRLDAILADPACDGVLAILTPHMLVQPPAIVEAIAAAAAGQESAPPGESHPPKPVLACLLGDASLEAAFRAAHAAHIPAYAFPEDAVHAFGALWQRGRWLRTAGDRGREAGDRRQGTGVQGRLAAGVAMQTALADPYAGLVAAYGIPTPPERLATTPEEAAAMAREIGFPVVLKIVSPDILHKSDIGGVILDVRDAAAARAGFATLVARATTTQPAAVVRRVQVQKMVTGGQEVIVGVKRDPIFGPLVMFGLGGIYVEALADVSFRLAPLTEFDAWEMIGEVRSAKLLAGVRGAAPADRPALVDAIVRIGQLATERPEIAELDVNPLLVLPEGQGVVAVDVRVIIDPRLIPRCDKSQ